MSRRPVANPLALAVLSCLWERPMYPYEVTTTLRERGKEDSIRLNFGSLYGVIKSLEKHGLIVAQQTEREGNRPERIVYAITEAGRREADEWLRELLDTPSKEYPAIETGLSLMSMLPPDEVAALLRGRVERLDTDIAEREHLQSLPETKRVPELFMIEFSYKLEMLRAERTFVAALVDRIAAGDIGGHDLWAQLHALLAQGHTIAEFQDQLAARMEKEADDSTP